MQRLELSGAVGPIYGSLGVKRLIKCPIPLVPSLSALFSAPTVLGSADAEWMLTENYGDINVT